MKKRIIVLTKRFPPYIGGVSNYWYNLLLGVTNLDVTVITNHQENILVPKNISVIGAKSYPLKYGIQLTFRWVLNVFSMVLLIGKTALQKDIDYIVAGQSEYFLVLSSFLAGLFFRKPYILFLHGEDIPQVKLKSNGFLRFMHRKAKARICNSNVTLEKLTKFCPDDNESAFIIYPGIEERFFEPVNEKAVSEIRSKYSLHNKKIIYTVARLSESKGHDMAIKAMALIVKKHPDTVYIIGGVGPREGYLKTLIEDLFLEPNIKLVGSIPGDSIVDFHNSGDIFLMPNRVLPDGESEGFGIVFLEANAVGNPVVGGRAGGTVDSIVDGITGYLVNPTNPQDIADKVCFLLENAAIAEELGKNGRKRAQNEFRWQGFSNKFESIIEKLGKS